MTTQEVAEKLVEWAVDTLPDLHGSYNHIASSKSQALPDVMVDFEEVYTAADDPDFPHRQLQQAWLMVRRAVLSFMVSNQDPEEGATQLRAFEEALKNSAFDDDTLGGRVEFISPRMRFDYTPPFVEYEDGTTGREMTMHLAIGELLED